MRLFAVLLALTLVSISLAQPARVTGGAAHYQVFQRDADGRANITPAGQSNMEGVGDRTDVQPPDGTVNSFDQTDRWGIAEEPLHRLVDAADRVHWHRNQQKEPEKLTGEALQNYIAGRKKGAGLGLPFAHGGTSMDQWDPALRDQGPDSLYGATLRRVRLGARLARLACHDWFPDNAACAALKRGPRPVSARFDNGVVRVEFGEVNGRLRAPGRPAGFSIHAPGGEPLAAIYKVRLEGNAALLHVQGKLPEGAALCYGNGKDPYCNVRDAADMALPVFGNLAIQ